MQIDQEEVIEKATRRYLRDSPSGSPDQPASGSGKIKGDVVRLFNSRGLLAAYRFRRNARGALLLTPID